MDPLSALLLVVAGLAGGFLAGLVGVGGGIIFSPVLFFFYSATGTDPALVPPLTLGSSIFCTLVAASSGAVTQRRGGSVPVDVRAAGISGAAAAAAVTAMTFLVTTRPWYSPEVFQFVLGLVLLAAVARMLVGRGGPLEGAAPRPGAPALVASGAAAGAVASAAGIGGGIVLVPVYNQLLRFPLRVATATSLATIVVISLTGTVTYVLAGLGRPTPPTALGFVDIGQAAWLAVPAVFSARWGVQAARRVRVGVIRGVFAVVAAVVAARLLGRAAGIL